MVELDLVQLMDILIALEPKRAAIARHLARASLGLSTHRLSARELVLLGVRHTWECCLLVNL